MGSGKVTMDRNGTYAGVVGAWAGVVSAAEAQVRLEEDGMAIEEVVDVSPVILF